MFYAKNIFKISEKISLIKMNNCKLKLHIINNYIISILIKFVRDWSQIDRENISLLVLFSTNTTNGILR